MLTELNQSDLSTMQAGTWYLIQLEGCISSDGSPYYITLRRGTVNKLLVYFNGGGLSWSEYSAARPFSLRGAPGVSEVFYIDRVSTQMLPNSLVGILSAAAPAPAAASPTATAASPAPAALAPAAASPFSDWYALNLPYATGDFHLGNNDFPYTDLNGNPKTLHHHGSRNVATALKALKTILPDTPEAIFIGGQSAGGYGSVGNSPAILSAYPDCPNITVYSEASHMTSDLWPDVARDTWKVDPSIQAYLKSNDLIADLFKYASDQLPSHTTFLHSNSVWDGLLTELMNKLLNDTLAITPEAQAIFHKTLIALVKRLKAEIPNFYYFLTDYALNPDTHTTPHTFSVSPTLFTAEMQDGHSIASWLASAVEGDPKNHGEKFLL
ncbi:MAG: hypothetical protein FWD45_00605 [Coriobacteriia bacterium]|nr:hypothetical protein [Coriobacteriia bacterium]